MPLLSLLLSYNEHDSSVFEASSDSDLEKHVRFLCFVPQDWVWPFHCVRVKASRSLFHGDGRANLVSTTIVIPWETCITKAY